MQVVHAEAAATTARGTLGSSCPRGPPGPGRPRTYQVRVISVLLLFVGSMALVVTAGLLLGRAMRVLDAEEARHGSDLSSEVSAVLAGLEEDLRAAAASPGNPV